MKISMITEKTLIITEPYLGLLQSSIIELLAAFNS